MKRKFVDLFLIFAMLLLFVSNIYAAVETKIEIGDYLEMGRYYDEPILWRCVDIDDNGPLMLSDKIICLKPFDASGTNASDSHGRGHVKYGTKGFYRRYYGSDHWASSNIRSWLNSDESAGNVVWLCGNSPINEHVWEGYNDYAYERGFKNSFTSDELDVVKTVTQDSILYEDEYEDMTPYGTEYHAFQGSVSIVVQNAKTTAYREQVEDDFFLLDVNQINAVYNNRNILGDDYHIGKISTQAVNNSEFSSDELIPGEKWKYWLRTPSAGHVYGLSVRFVHSKGGIFGSLACYGDYGIRPAFYMAHLSDLFVTGNGTETDPYRIGEKPSVVLAATKPEEAEETTVTQETSELEKKESINVMEGDKLIVKVNSRIIIFPDAQPYIDKNNRTQIPIRAVAEGLGCEVDWDDATRTAVIKRGNDVVYITIGKDTLQVGNKTVQMDTAAEIKDERTYIPVRFVGEALGMQVNWIE